jgi:lysophospholipase L1-like esterase
MVKNLQKLFYIFVFFSFSKAFKLAQTNLLSENENPIKIMCIGDSITDGFGIAGSYRKFLFDGLTKKNYKIDMIGSKSGYNTKFVNKTSGDFFEYDDDNTGYSAYSIKSYPGRNGIYDTLVSSNCLSQKPDIVILQIGTNNIIDNHDKDENSKDFESLLDYILENIPSTSMLFVTTIPDVDPNRQEVRDWFANYRHSPNWDTIYDDQVVEFKVQLALNTYNTDITSRVKARMEKGQNIRPADVNKTIKDVKKYLADGVHPNEEGYKVMGEYWTKVIDDYLQKKLNPSSSEPTSNNSVENQVDTFSGAME